MLKEILRAQFDAGGSTIPGNEETSPSGSRMPSNPNQVDRRSFLLYWRRKFHRIRFLYGVVKLLRSLASLGFETWDEAEREGATVEHLAAEYLPEFESTSPKDADAREDISSMGTRPQEEVEASYHRPLREEIFKRLNDMLSREEAVRGEFQYFEARLFFREHGPAGHFARNAINLYTEIRRDRDNVARRREVYGQKKTA